MRGKTNRPAFSDRKRITFILIFLLLTLAAVLISIMSGSIIFSMEEIYGVLFNKQIDHPFAYQIINNVRLPRTLIGWLVGTHLGMAGALLQGLLRNPLASPNTIGVNAGAALAAVLLMTFIPANIAFIPPAAFAGALLTSFMIYGLSVRAGGSNTVTIILAGVALSALFGGLTSALMIIYSDELEVTYSWLLGGLSGRGWPYFQLIWPYSIIGILMAIHISPKMNLMILGDEVAQNLGLSLERSRILTIITASILAGSAVSVAGTIGFIGIIAPHAARLLIGNDYRYLTALSGLMGGLLLIMADTVARTVFQPVEIPVGIITVILGAPFFLMILYRKLN